MDYEKIYQSLVVSRQYRGVKRECGFEVHHVLPRSMGGTDVKGNLVKLTHQEHVLAHKLLVRFTKGQDFYKMDLALKYMMSIEGGDPLENKRKYTKFRCKFDLLLPHQTAYIPFPSRPILTCTGITKLKTTLEGLGYKPNKLNEKQRVNLKTAIFLLIYAHKYGFKGVIGLRNRSTNSVNIELTNRLLSSGHIIGDEVEYGNGICYSLTDSGVAYLKLTTMKCWLSCEKELNKGLSSGIQEIVKWNEDNPNNLLYSEFVKGRRGCFIMRPFHRWTIPFLDLMGNFEPTTRKGVGLFISSLNKEPLK